MEGSIFYRRNLPHISRAGRPIFVTLITKDRRILPPGARTVVLRHVMAMHGVRLWMDVAVVMPDHVHLVFTLLSDPAGGGDQLKTITKGMKGASARRVNQLLGRRGNLWQIESFDHVVRSAESTHQKLEYVCNNPVRAGLVKAADEYPWLWRSWVEGGERGVLPAWVRP